ncbi:MAG TPA: hypothetical protein VI911_09090 [Patescibacteria group bacterium]|nr:hypothetical protein [Patescibacteria group bacterium]
MVNSQTFLYDSDIDEIAEVAWYFNTLIARNHIFLNCNGKIINLKNISHIDV